jgi:hypothetical protein
MPLPQKQKTNEKKIPKSFMLTVLKDGYYQPLSYEEFQKFLAENPNLANFFTDTPVDNSSSLNSLPVPDIPENA